MKRDEFIDIMSGIMEMYPGRFESVGNFAMEMWYEGLMDLDFSTTKKAIINHIKTSKFPPTVADIREQYAACKEARKEYITSLENIFKEIKEYYPNGDEDGSAESSYYCWLCDVEPVERYRSANKLKAKVFDYVKKCESGMSALDMTLSDCIERMVERI